uniref:C6 domain-containing protein n=1 Tax=Panagrolaimus davidi TaxID=227884 RepID=A0A914P723_9BILA
MYEQNNRGTCTIFERTLWITKNPNSKHTIYKKCEKMPPAVSAKCCGQLVQRHSTSGISDGIMTVVYNDEACRSTATVTCSQPQKQGSELSAAIIVNEIVFVESGPKNITLPATCYNGVWQIAQPPLNVISLECLVTDPVGSN